MKFIKLILLIFIMTQAAFALDLDSRRKRIISIIDEELSEVKRLSGQQKHRNPDHLLRMAELNLEKARLWREKENQEYLAMPAAKRRKTNKKRFYKISASYFKEASRLCTVITKKHKRYNAMGDVYYILGFNAKEAGNNKTATKYFSRANKKAPKNSVTRIKSQISLAELYYNKKQFNKAIPLYENALRKHKDKWWTKDSFNLAWCYFRANRHSKAISKMKEVFKASTNKNYIDHRAQVERDIGLFFATAGRIDEGVKFYKKIGINFTDQLLRIAVNMKAQGKYATANKTLGYALKYDKSKKKRAEIYIEQMDLFASFGKIGQHLKAANNLHKLYKSDDLTANQIKTLKFQVAKMGARLQKQIASKTYARLKKIRKTKANRAIAYFGLLANIDKKKAEEHVFFQGESAFVANMYSKSLAFYQIAFDLANKKNNKTIKNRSIDGMLASLGKRSVSKKIKEKNYVPVYETYLAAYPKGKRAKSIYQKLFRVYLERKQYDKTKSVLDRFAGHYPKDYKTQEAMIAELMEISRKRKDHKTIKAWITDINAGKYKISKKYAKKLKELLTSIQIDDVQNSLSKGDKRAALIGYHNILKDPHVTKKSKINAKYNLAALYYELGRTKESYKWSVDAIKEMKTKDAKGFSDSFLTIASFLFTKLEFQASADLTKRLLAKLCSSTTRRKGIAFKNGVYIYLADNDIKKTEAMIKLGEKCKVPRKYIVDVKFELLKEYKKLKAWTKYERLVNELSSNKSVRNELIVPSHILAGVFAGYGNSKKANKHKKNVSRFYYQSRKKKLDIPLEALDIMAAKKVYGLKVQQRKILNTKLRFPEKTFNKLMQKKLKWLDKLTGKAGSVQSIGSGEGIISAYEILINTTEKFAKEIESFTPPKKSAAYIKGFKKSMAGVYKPLLQTAKNYRKELWSNIKQNEILSTRNSAFAPANLGVPINYWFPKGGVLMDRGGQR